MKDNIFLIVGGSKDQEILWIINKLKFIEDNLFILFTDKKNVLNWNINNDELLLNNIIIYPKSIFIRENVYNKNEIAYNNSRRWNHILKGWIMSHNDVNILNRFWLNKYNNKAYNMCLAKQIGINIPVTYLTNNISFMKENIINKDFIVKPIDNGFCFDAKKKINECQSVEYENILISATPTFFQELLDSIELRIYILFDEYWIFLLNSSSLDHRIKQDANVILCNKNIVSKIFINKLKKMAGILKLDYCAFDFKLYENELRFLEVNDFPMFSYFDNLCNNEISNKIINKLYNSNI
jgi:glutathione synthase/RimK-type ligase-like ATP-grasp enzyme